MPSPSFQGLTRQLLDAGIAPKFAERLRRELEDHYRDLEREVLDAEPCPQAAAREARRRLGADETIAQEFMCRPELKAWIYRSRWAVSCLRGVCVVYLLLRGVRRAVAARGAGLARFAAAGVAATVLTVGLLLVLEASISAAPPPALRMVGTVRTLTAGDFRIAEAENDPAGPEATAAAERLPIFEPPRVAVPRLPEPVLEPERVAVAALEVEMTLEMPLEGQPRLADRELLPIIKVPPQFPALAARRGLEGYVLIEYTVTRTGSVSDVVVVESSSELFERPALEAVSKFKYQPRIVDGMAVPVRGVRARMRFVLEA